MSKKSLLKNISFFTFFNVLNSAIPFLLLPVLTKHLSPADYGIIDIFMNVSMLATPIIGLSIVQSISRFYFDDVNLPKFISTVITILVISGISFIILGLLFTFFFSDFLVSYGMPPLLVVYALVYTFFSQISEVLLILWRVSYKTLQFGTFRVTKTGLDIGSSILLIVTFGFGWEGRIAPQILVALIFAAISIVLLVKKKMLFNLKVDTKYKREAMSFSLPMVFHSLGGNIIGFSDRFFILIMLGISDVGVYAVGYQIGMVVALLQNSFNQAWVPYFFERLKNGGLKDKLQIVRITYLYFGFLIVTVVFFYLTIPYIYTYFIGESYSSGLDIVFWILLGYAFNGMYKMVVNYLFFLKETKLIAYTTFGSAVVNLVLNYMLIGLNGMIGAAQATTITFLLLFLSIFVISSRKYKMPWGLNKKWT